MAMCGKHPGALGRVPTPSRENQPGDDTFTRYARCNVPNGKTIFLPACPAWFWYKDFTSACNNGVL